MVRITNGEQIALALQARLKRLSRKSRQAQASKPGTTDKVSLDHTRSSDSADFPEDLDRPSLNRLIIRRFLEDEFGTDFTKDHRFDPLVDYIAKQVEADPETEDLLSTVIEELRSGD